LRFRGYTAIGAIHKNRIPKYCPLTNKTLFKKKNCGYFETFVERKDGLLYLRLMDNAVITTISSSCGSWEVGKVNLFSQKEKQNLLVPRSRIIVKYNTYMGMPRSCSAK